MVESAVQDGELIPIAGRRLGRYDLVSRLARGGMAEVWLARQIGELGFSRVVALKMIRPEHASDASFRNMFLDEARLAARLHHANAVEVLDLGETDRVLYLAMAYVEGESLHGLIARLRDRSGEGARLPVPVSVRILSDVCAGLHAAHELLDDEGRPLDLVHRDVSPHNVLVGLDGIARVTDFGIAKALGRLTEETDTGHVKGKLAYLSPEQARRMPPDRRADIFAAGIILWELLTGRRLFKGEDVPDTLLNVSTKKIESPRSIAQEVPDAIAEVTMRALEREPSARYQTASEMADALESAARSSGQLSTAKAVADFVGDLVLEDVERRRAGVRASTIPPSQRSPGERASHPSLSGERAIARSGDHAEVTVREGKREATSTRTSSVVPTSEASGPPKRLPLAWIGAGAAVAAAVTWLATARDRAPQDGGSRPPSPSAPSSAAPIPTPPVVTPTASGVAEVETSAAAASASQTPSRKAGPAGAAPNASAKRSAEPQSPSSARPKYDNPYGQ